MATYAELFDLRTSSALRNRVQIALAIKAHGILQEGTPSADRLTFAEDTLKGPASKIEEALWYLFAEDKALTPAQIEGATDTDIQTRVDNYVNKLAP